MGRKSRTGILAPDEGKSPCRRGSTPREGSMDVHMPHEDKMHAHTPHHRSVQINTRIETHKVKRFLKMRVQIKVCGSTRQEHSWQWSVGCGNRSPLKQPRPLKLHPSHTPHAQPSRAGCGHDTARHLLCVHTTSPLCGDKGIHAQ